MLRNFLALSLLVAICSSTGWSQYKVLPVAAQFKTESAIKKKRSNKSRVFNNSAEFSPDGKKVIDEYYKGYVLPTMTNIKEGSKFGTLRIELQKDLASAKSTSARKYVSDMIYGLTKKIADGSKYHPGARYNAMLVLGDLNDVEATFRGAAKPPLPKEAVLRDLLTRYKHPKTSDVIKMGALLGLLRHAELRTHPASPKPLSAAQRAGLAKYAVAMMAVEKAPEGRDADGHNWMRRRSAELVGVCGVAGAKDVYAKALIKVILEPESDLSVRCAAAEALGKLDLKSSTLKADDVAKTLGKLAVDCTSAEIEILKEMLLSRGGGGGEYGGGGYGGDDEIVFSDERTIPTRRRLITRLLQVKSGLVGDGKKGGIQHSMKGGDKASEEIVMAVDSLLENAKNHEFGAPQLGKALRTQSTELSTKVAGVAAAAAPATPAAG
jgi:hypothetical protein